MQIITTGLKKLSSIIMASFFILLFLNCTPEFWQGFNRGLANSQNINNSSGKLMLFGGEYNQTYLGCLNCSEVSYESIFNEFGSYGSKYSQTSIWNQFGTYGSKYSQYSPWNPYAANPPVIVDEKGGFCGYFTVNKYFSQRTTLPSILKILNSYNE